MILQTHPMTTGAVIICKSAAKRLYPKAFALFACSVLHPHMTVRDENKVPTPGVMTFRMQRTTDRDTGMRGIAFLKKPCRSLTVTISYFDMGLSQWSTTGTAETTVLMMVDFDVVCFSRSLLEQTGCSPAVADCFGLVPFSVFFTGSSLSGLSSRVD